MLPRFVICGLEHCGTTLLGELFRQVPGLDSGFEVGVLLARRPRDLPDWEPFYAQMLWGWGIGPGPLAWCCDTDDFATFYARLRDVATLKPDTREIFDKTPRYLGTLPDCMARAQVPFIAIIKDPRAIAYSDFLKAGSGDFDTWFGPYAEDKAGYMREAYAHWRWARETCRDRVLLLRLEDICADARRTCERMFAHAGLHFQPGYLALQNVRFANTRGGSIAAGMPFTYQAALGATRCRRIKQAFAEFSDWFYD